MILLSVAGVFLLFILFDLNDVLWKKKFGRIFFPLGLLGLLFISVKVIVHSVRQIDVRGFQFVFGSLLGCAFFVALIYTLFFAIPLGEAYGKEQVMEEKRRACTTGMYALCRHPGVIWLAFFYATCYLAIPTSLMLWLFLSTTACNVGYVGFQDKWTFPRLFVNYPEYQKETPFLIPNVKSIKKCLSAWKREKEL